MDYSEVMMEEYVSTYPHASTIKSEAKLLATQRDKAGYIVHYRALRLYLELGLILKRIIRVVKFRQSKFLAPYINYNITQRIKNK